MMMGTGSVLKRVQPQTRLIALQPSTSTVLTGGVAGPHNVEGVAPGFVPPQFDSKLINETRSVDEQEGREMCLRLAREEGIFAGTSTGLNVVGAIELAKEIGPGGVVVTVAVDTGMKYLSGGLYSKL
jgi:cysteine synthase